VATRIETPALSFFPSSLLLFGVFGTLLLYRLIASIVFKLPGNVVDKIFILFYILVLGNFVTSTITWFILGCMTFLMIRKTD